MSGGFFRGTSADQDTRFSNKQAKLLKSQKFPAELDHLVDMTKVKMDVIRPWIATRATEVLGFEDEVLINFVYGLLEGKAVDGKKIQIQLTGFMEKNTGKFMKELWCLLLSAQNNASGVPQQFLDAKEEEMKKKKMETDRINQEINKRKERGGWESEQDRKIRMDGLKEPPRNAIPNSDETLKNSTARSPSVEPKAEREVGRKDGSRRKSRSSYSPARSSSKSFSKSRSYSEERHSSRSPSVSPRHQRHLVSRDRRYRSPSKHSISPRRIQRSPSRRRSPHFRQRSISRSRYRSPSPVRRRTPERRRSPSPVRRRTPERRRSPSPVRRRTPERRRSPSPVRCRIPERRRSPLRRQFRSPPPTRRRSPTWRSPVHSRRKSPSPLQLRSPAGYRTSTRHRSPSPELRRSPSFRSPRRRSQSPARRKMDSNSPSRHMNRNHSSPGSRSPNQRRRSKDADSPAIELDSRRSEDDNQKSPVRLSDKKQVKLSLLDQREVDSILNKKSISLRSPQQDTKTSENEIRDDVDPKKWKHSPMKVSDSNKYSLGEVEAHRSPKRHETSIGMERKSGQRSSNVNPPERPRNQHSSMLEDIKNSPSKVSRESSLSSPEQGVSPQYRRQSNQQSLLKSPSLKEGHFFEDKKQMYEKRNVLDIELNIKADKDIEEAAFHSDAEDDSRLRERKLEGGAKRSSYEKECRDAKDGSKMDERESKRRKKDERRLRKEEKRRKREERHRRKEERRAGKKSKCVDTVNPPSDNDRGHLSADDTDGEDRTRLTYRSDMDDAESRQKRLEIELREKALESLRAKKAINH